MERCDIKALQLLQRLGGEADRSSQFAVRVLATEMRTLLCCIDRLSTTQRQRLAQNGAYLEPTLQALVLQLEERREAPSTSQDIRTVISALSCLVEHAASPGSTPHIEQPVRIDYARFDFAADLRATLLPFQELAWKRNISFDVTMPEEVHCEADRKKLQFVLLNLFFNATKYTPRDGSISCQLQVHPGSNEIDLKVHDSGPGVDPAIADAIFERSRQLDRSIFLTISGMRLSLGTCRDFLRLHGGTLSLELSDRQGATFCASLPTKAPIASQVHEQPSECHSLAGKVADIAALELRAEELLSQRPVHVDDRPLMLIVEDSQAIQRLFVRAFEPELRTVSALDGVAGLERALALRPDIILADIQLPRLNGGEMIARMRSHRALAGTPIIVLTASNDEAFLAKLLASGVQDVMRKPFMLPELKARVKNLLEAKKARDVLGALCQRQETDLVKLADQVTERQRQLREAFNQVDEARRLAEAANQVKGNFLRMMSHELKTPIATLTLQVHLLQREVKGAQGPDLQSSLGRIERSNQRLLHLIETALTWARLDDEHKPREAKSFDVQKCAAQSVNSLATQAQQKGLRIDLQSESMPPLVSSPEFCRLIISGLLYRAVQISRGGAVRVSLGFAKGTHWGSVKDTGLPVSEDEERDLLEPLRSGYDLHSRAGSGSGLGLYVVRDFVRALGGELTLKRHKKNGNEWCFTLPSLSVDDAASAAECRVDSMEANHTATGG